jgi:hypothetical protein
VRQTWWSRRAIALHVVIIIVVPSFAALCLWQVHRALGGNGLSWAYVFEWPFFAGYAIYMWWKFLHEAPPAGRQDPAGDAITGAELPERNAQAQSLGPDAGAPDPEASERAAYNDYLSALATRGRRKQWR